MNKPTKLIAIAIATLAGHALPAEDWNFAISPYLWFAGIEGDVSTIAGLPSVPVDISSSKALEDLEASYMVWFDARRGRHGFFLDFTYTDIRSEVTLVEVVDLTMESVSKNTLGMAAYSYNLYTDESGFIDFMVGARYWDIDTTLNFSAGTGDLAGKSIHNTETWVDPLVAIKGRMAIGNSSFYAGGILEAGGFGVGSSIFYDVNLNFGYQWTPWFGTAVGYRFLDVDYADDGFEYDVSQHGWMVNLTFQF